MSTPNSAGAATFERARLEYDDGSGIDFLSPEDALFFLCYGREIPLHDGQPKAPTTMLGVKQLRLVVHTDADPRVIDGEPALVHTEPVLGNVVWDRDRLDQLVLAAHRHEHPDLPVVDGVPGLGAGDDGELNKNTIAALTEHVVAQEA